MTGGVRAPGAVRILSPVADLLGGVTPDGMVCGVDGVCVPADGLPGTGLPADETSGDQSSTGEQN